jgi:hypothetical protein
MHMRACVFALILISLLCPALHAASFDCSKADSPIQKAICSDPKLTAAESTMATLYRTDLAQLSSASIGFLRADQVQWLAWMQQLCHADDGLLQTPAIATCLQPLYYERIKALRKSVLRQDGMSFLIRTQYLAAPESGPIPGNPPHPGFGTLRASWPAADTADEDWVAWNHTTEQRMLRMVGPVDNTPPPTQWTDDLAQSQDTTAEAHLKSVEHDRVTTGLSVQTMGHGAAHPSESWQTLTYLLTQHRALRADDVFTPTAPWRETLAQIAWKQISTGDKKTYIYEQIKGPDAKEIQQVLLNTGNWTLEHDGLHISYPEYAVSPRFAPMDDTVIPWSDLKSLLSQAFVQP